MVAASSDAAPPALGPFRARGVVGRGGTSVVYEVASAKGERLALKVQLAELAPSTKERERFLAEAERMGRVTHPSLVPVRGSGVLPDGRAYLLMPLLEGETLAARIAKGPMPLATALDRFAELASAVHALHVASLVHRDVKPENVVLESRGGGVERAVLLDFGIARASDDRATTTTLEGRVRGTPAFMAPERFFGAEASVSSDVYELAVTLYAMLAGTLPWRSETSASDRLDPAPLDTVRPGIPRALATVVLRALSTRPEARPPSAEALAAEVRAASAERPLPERTTEDLEVRAVAVPPPEHAPARRAWLFAPAAVLLATTAFAFASRGATRAPAATVEPALPVTSAPSPPLPSALPIAEPTPIAEAHAPSTPARSAPGKPRVSAATAVPLPSPPAPSSTTLRRREDWFEDRK